MNPAHHLMFKVHVRSPDSEVASSQESTHFVAEVCVLSELPLTSRKKKKKGRGKKKKKKKLAWASESERLHEILQGAGQKRELLLQGPSRPGGVSSGGTERFIRIGNLQLSGFHVKSQSSGPHPLSVGTTVPRGRAEEPAAPAAAFPLNTCARTRGRNCPGFTRAAPAPDPSADPGARLPAGLPPLAPARRLQGSGSALLRPLVRESRDVRRWQGPTRGAASRRLSRRRPAPEADTHFRQRSGRSGARRGRGAGGPEAGPPDADSGRARAGAPGSPRTRCGGGGGGGGCGTGSRCGSRCVRWPARRLLPNRLIVTPPDLFQARFSSDTLTATFGSHRGGAPKRVGDGPAGAPRVGAAGWSRGSCLRPTKPCSSPLQALTLAGKLGRRLFSPTPLPLYPARQPGHWQATCGT